MLQMRNPGNGVGFKGLRCGDGDEENGGLLKRRRSKSRRGKGPKCERNCGGLEERSPARLITRGSKFPVSHFRNIPAIVLKEAAIHQRPTFHLRLTFMSSTQFYHSERDVYPSSDTALVLLLLKPCRPPNHLPAGPARCRLKPTYRLITQPRPLGRSPPRAPRPSQRGAFRAI